MQFCLVLCRCSAFESEVKRLRIFKKVCVCEECYKNLAQIHFACIIFRMIKIFNICITLGSERALRKFARRILQK